MHACDQHSPTQTFLCIKRTANRIKTINFSKKKRKPRDLERKSKRVRSLTGRSALVEAAAVGSDPISVLKNAPLGFRSRSRRRRVRWRCGGRFSGHRHSSSGYRACSMLPSVVKLPCARLAWFKLGECDHGSMLACADRCRWGVCTKTMRFSRGGGLDRGPEWFNGLVAAQLFGCSHFAKFRPISMGAKNVDNQGLFGNNLYKLFKKN